MRLPAMMAVLAGLAAVPAWADDEPPGLAGGMTLELDVGQGVPLAIGNETTHAGLTSGVAVGYQRPSGWSFAFRYEGLGIDSALVDDTSAHLFVLGARYVLPFHVPEPFLELMCGPAMAVTSVPESGSPLAVGTVSGTTWGFGGAIGAGVALPLGRHFSIGVVARDWLVGAPPGVLQVPTFQLFLNANFGALFS